jgi:MFS superfamily sulfate permease-like transporter
VHGRSIADQVRSFLGVVHHIHWPTFAVAAGTLAVLIVVLRVRPRWPAPLLAVAAATVVGTIWDLADKGVRSRG